MDVKQTLYKAALLHDIGKFWQRTRQKETYKEKGEGRGQKSHPLLSEGFVDEWLKDDLIADIVAFHHKGDLDKSGLQGKARALASLVCAADHMASGEREEDEKPFPRYFHSIFSQISLPVNPSRPDECGNTDKPAYKQDICPLNTLDYKFPFKDKNPEGNMKEGYRAQWEKLAIDAPHIAEAHPDTLFYLSKKHLWSVPSAYYFSKPDISLHEHSRLAAAVAVCLYDYIGSREDALPLEEWTLKYVQSFNKEKGFRLLCAELSGIQKYIYHIAHTGAMRALKGRSFWLQQIVDSVANHILERFKLPLSNLIFSGGGKLIVLLPNTDSVKNELPAIQADIESRVFDEYDGNISLVFGEIELEGNEFFGKKISGKWDDLYKKVKENKSRKMAVRLDASSGSFEPDFFIAKPPYGSILQCKATKREICMKQPEKEGKKVHIGMPAFIERTFAVNGTSTRAYQLTDKETKEPLSEEYICEEQFNSQRIGYQIRKDCLGIAITDKGFSVLDDLETVSFFLKDDALTYAEKLLLFNDDDFLNALKDKKIPKGWKFYGGDWVPLDETGETREFEEIISDAMGIERLGVLRMDVDNLGEVFKDGLGGNATFSRLVQLSGMLDFFFSGYLNILKEMVWTVGQGIVSQGELTEAEALALDERDDKSAISLRDVLQIVYAGGDDLFIVGVWNVLPDLAWWIYKKFEEFTCHNPCFCLSAGIALFDNKYPVYKAAKYAGQALEDAKSKWRDKQGVEREKGRISFLNKSMSWKDFEISRHLAKELYGTTEQLKRGLINRLQEMYGNYFSVKQQLKWMRKYEPQRVRPFEKAEWSKWRWRGCYSLYRFAEQQGRKKYEYIRQLAADIFVSRYHFSGNPDTAPTDADFITFLDVPVRWADLLIRTKK